MSHQFQKLWLKVTAVVIGSFGPVFLLGSMAATAEPARFTLDLLSWPLDGSTTFAQPETRFLSALAGGFLTGWGVMIWCLAGWVHDLAPEAVRRSVLAGIAAWFVVDSAGSVLSGNPLNVLFNLVVMAVAIGPLWRPASDAALAPGRP